MEDPLLTHNLTGRLSVGSSPPEYEFLRSGHRRFVEVQPDAANALRAVEAADAAIRNLPARQPGALSAGGESRFDQVTWVFGSEFHSRESLQFEPRVFRASGVLAAGNDETLSR